MAVKKNTLLIVAGSLLILLLIGVTILLISEKQTNKELVMEFNLDKEDLENQYTDFARQYDELKLTVSNDSLSVLLEQEQLKTQRLLEELRTVKLPLRTLRAGTIEDPTFIGRTPHREEQQCHRDTPSEEGTGLSPQSHDRLYQPD